MASQKSVVKEGVVVLKNRKFFVNIGRAQKELPTGPLLSPETLRALVGQKVPVTIFGKSVVSLGKRPGILCYLPADPYLVEQVQPELQVMLRQVYEKAGILTEE